VTDGRERGLPREVIGLIIAETGRAPGQCSILYESEEAEAKKSLCCLHRFASS